MIKLKLINYVSSFLDQKVLFVEVKGIRSYLLSYIY